jgi:ubiquinone/menaquinone biosynthesis C-methylase UbiE
MRSRLHEHFARLFRPGDRVLDFTAGTGVDACYLAARGVQVVALDCSPGMIAQLRLRAAPYGSSVEAQVLAAEHLGQFDAGYFDGAVSTFAGLNTISDLPHLARDLAVHLRAGGRVVLHALSADCWWRSTFRAGRTWVHIGGCAVAHQPYEPKALWRDAFAAHFVLRQTYALCVVPAPSLVARMPWFASMVFALDRTFGRLVPAKGEFFVMELSRRDSLP